MVQRILLGSRVSGARSRLAFGGRGWKGLPFLGGLLLPIIAKISSILFCYSPVACTVPSDVLNGSFAKPFSMFRVLMTVSRSSIMFTGSLPRMSMTSAALVTTCSRKPSYPPSGRSTRQSNASLSSDGRMSSKSCFSSWSDGTVPPASRSFLMAASNLTIPAWTPSGREFVKLSDCSPQSSES